MPPPRRVAPAIGAALALQLVAATAGADRLDDAIALHLSGRQEEALAAYRSIVEDPSTPPATVARAANAACVLRNDRGEAAAALAECRRAERLRRENGDLPGLARTLNNLALAHQGLGDAEAAARVFREALALDRQVADPEEEAVTLANLAALEIGGGRYGAALDRLAEGEALARANAGAAWSSEQLRVARLNRAVALERLGAHPEALAELLELAREPEPDRRHEAALAANLGVVYRNLGDPRRAQRELARAAAIFRAERDLGGLANALLNAGQIDELHLREPERAAARYAEALDAAVRGGDRAQETLARLFHGRLLAAAGRSAEAGGELERALAAALRDGDPEAAWTARRELARLARAAGDDRRALALLEEAVGEVESIRAGAGSRSGAAAFLTDKREVFAATIELAAERAVASGSRADTLAALALVERAKARELLDGLRGGTLKPLDAGGLERLAAAPTTRLEFYAGERSLWRFAVGRGAVAVAARGPAARILATAGDVHAALARGEPPAAADLATLGAALLGDLVDLGGTRALDASLDVAPDARLRYLPFELLAPAPGLPPLVESARIAYWPSLSAIGGSRAAAPARWRFAGFAAPVEEREAPPSSARGLLDRRFSLGRLPASAREVEDAARRLGGAATLHTGQGATEAALAHAARQGVKVLHLATHAIVDERLAEGATLLLAPAGESDGLLTAGDVAALPLEGAVVVLSACRSALGSTADGRALSTLTGAFLAAGAQGVVATLWEIGDEAAAAVMDQFYFELGRGRAPGDALARVKRRLRGDPRWSDPAVWSAFVLVGDPPPVVPAARRAGARAFVVAVLAAAAAVFWRASYRRGSRRSSATEPASSPPSEPSATTRKR